MILQDMSLILLTSRDILITDMINVNYKLIGKGL